SWGVLSSPGDCMHDTMTVDAVTKQGKSDGIASCLLCGGRKIHYDFSIGKFRVEECASCGLMRLNPQPTDVMLADLYGAGDFPFRDSDEGQLHASDLKSHTADHYLDLLESYMGAPPAGHLLEVGCGTGDFLVRAAARGLSVTGIEYSPDFAQTAA